MNAVPEMLNATASPFCDLKVARRSPKLKRASFTTLVGKRRSQRGDCGEVSQFLNTGAREIVLAQRLVLRLDLNTGDLARVVAEPETELMLRCDQVVQAERVERCIVGNRKHSLQIVQRSESYELTRGVRGAARNRRA